MKNLISKFFGRKPNERKEPQLTTARKQQSLKISDDLGKRSNSSSNSRSSNLINSETGISLERENITPLLSSKSGTEQVTMPEINDFAELPDKLQVGKTYTRKDVAALVNQNNPPSGGDWITSYVQVGRNLIIFLNIGITGTTGHNFPNRFERHTGQLTWFSKPGQKSTSALFQRVLNNDLSLLFFVRFEENGKFEHLGKGKVRRHWDGSRTSHGISIKMLVELEHPSFKNSQNIVSPNMPNTLIEQQKYEKKLSVGGDNQTLSEIIREHSNNETLQKLINDEFLVSAKLSDFLYKPEEFKKKLKLIPTAGEKTQKELLKLIEELTSSAKITNRVADTEAKQNDGISVYEYIQKIDCSYFLKSAAETTFFKTVKVREAVGNLEVFELQLKKNLDLRESLKNELIERLDAAKQDFIQYSNDDKIEVQSNFKSGTSSANDKGPVDRENLHNHNAEKASTKKDSTDTDLQSCDEVQASLIEAALDQDIVQKPVFTNKQLEILSTRLSTIGFSVRLNNCLGAMNCTYVCDVVRLTEAQLLRQRNLGRNSVYELKKYISKHGLSLGIPIGQEDVEKIIDSSQGYPKNLADKLSQSYVDDKHKTLQQNVFDISFSERAKNVFNREKINVLGDLCKYSTLDLRRLPNMGEKTIREIQTVLEKYSLKLGEVDQSWDREKGWRLNLTDTSFSTYTLKQLQNSLLKIENLDLPIRAQNSFRDSGLIYIGEVCNFTNKDLKKLPNMGKTTVEKIELLLRGFDLFLGMWAGKWNETFIREELEIRLSLGGEVEDTQLVFIGPPTPKFLAQSHETLIHKILEGLTDRHKDILERRANFSTLEEIGNEYNVTRERIRQIEKAANKKFLQQVNLIDEGFIVFLIPKLFESLCKIPNILNQTEIDLSIVPKHLRMIYMALGKKCVYDEFNKICLKHRNLLIRKSLDFEKLVSEKKELVSYIISSQFSEIYIGQKVLSQQLIKLLEEEDYYIYRSLLFQGKPTIRKRRLANIFEMTLQNSELLQLENCLITYKECFPEDPCSLRDLEIVIDGANGLFAYKRFGFANYHASSSNKPKMRAEATDTNNTTDDVTISFENSIVNKLHSLFKTHGPMTINEATQIVGAENVDFSKNSVGPTLSDRQSEFSRVLPRMYYSDNLLKEADISALIQKYESKLVGIDQIKDFICFRAMGLDRYEFALWSEELFTAWQTLLHHKAESELKDLLLFAIDASRSIQDVTKLNQLCKSFLRRELRSKIDWTKVKLPTSEEFYIAVTFLRQNGYIGLTHCNFILGRQTRTSQSGISLLILMDLLGLIELDLNYFGVHTKSQKFDEHFKIVKNIYTKEILIDEDAMMRKVINDLIDPEAVEHQRAWYFYSDFQNMIGQDFDANSVANIEAEFELMHLFGDT